MTLQTHTGHETLPFPRASAEHALSYRMVGSPSSLTPKKWLVHGRIGAGDVVALYGDPGVGKSAVATHLAFAVAKEESWFGKKVQPGAVLFCGLERAAVTERRFAALQMCRRACDPAIGISSQQLSLGDKVACSAIIAAAHALSNDTGLPTRLIIIDTLSRAVAGLEESSAGAMSLVTANLSKIANETGATVLVVHHTTKSSGDLRGSSALLAAVDCAIRITKGRNSVFHASVEKANDVAEGSHFSFVMKPVELDFDRDTGAPNTAVVVEPLDDNQTVDNSGLRSRTKQIYEAIQLLLKEGSVSRSILLNDLREKGILSKRSGPEQLRQALVELKRLQLIDYDQKVIRASPVTSCPPQPNSHPL